MHNTNVEEIQDTSSFMKRLGESVNEAREFNDALTVTVTSGHRDNSEFPSTVLSLQVNNEDNLTVVEVLTVDQVLSIFDYITSQGHKNIPSKFALAQMRYAVMNIFSGEYDEVEISGEIEDRVFKGAAFQGIVSALIFTIDNDTLKISYTVSGELLADTAAAEIARLKQLGLDSSYVTSTPNKLIPLLLMSAVPLYSLVN